MRILTVPKKSKLRLYTTVVLKDVKKDVFYVLVDKNKLLNSIKLAYVGIFLNKKNLFFFLLKLNLTCL